MSMKKIFLAIFGLLALYLLLFPSPIDPIALNFPRMELADNDKLGKIEVLFPRVCQGCEDISFDDQGHLYTGHKDGKLKKFPLNGGSRLTEVLQFKGRPLGLEVIGDSMAWVAVEHEGLAKVDLRDGTYDIVVNAFNDTTFMLIDYLDVAASGNVYFTDASDAYGDDDLQYDILQGRPNGALYRYLPATGVTERLVDHLHFANGV
ncbi:MAG: SMP-30/gluconolactonase/LRE family protein, partial [Lewinella sp.]